MITNTPWSIVLATDGSEAARAAESWVTRAKWRQPPVVDVLCVAGRGVTRLGWSVLDRGASLDQAAERLRVGELVAAQRISNEVGERLQQSGLAVRTWARQGDAAEMILETADQERSQLVVVGPRGRSGLATMILGSVTQRLVEQAEPAVLVARPPAESGASMPQRPLVLVTGDSGAVAAVRWLGAAGWLTGARLRLVGLLGDRPGLDYEDAAASDDLLDLVRQDAATLLDRIAEPAASLAEAVDVEVRSGHPVQAALDAGEEYGADLVAVVRRPRRHRPDPLVADVSRNASASVLIVPAEWSGP